MLLFFLILVESGVFVFAADVSQDMSPARQYLCQRLDYMMKYFMKDNVVSTFSSPRYRCSADIYTRGEYGDVYISNGGFPGSGQEC